jgi:hypothetical protein
MSKVLEKLTVAQYVIYLCLIQEKLCLKNEIKMISNISALSIMQILSFLTISEREESKLLYQGAQSHTYLEFWGLVQNVVLTTVSHASR